MAENAEDLFYPPSAAAVSNHREEKGERGAVDAEIVARAREGDPEAQEALVRCLSPRLLRLALRLVRDEQLAEELVGEALYRGVLKLKNLRENRAVAAWFSRILVNRWRDHVRRSERSFVFLEDLPEPPASADWEPETAATVGELRERVARALACLPPGQRAILTLHIDQGFTVSEIAELLESAPQRVKANLWHGRQRLRQLLGDLLGEKAKRDGS